MDATTSTGRSRSRDRTNASDWTAIHASLVPLMRANGPASARAIAREYACLACAIGAGAWAWSAASLGALAWWAFGAIAFCLIAAIAALQHRLSGLAHEASHYVLFRGTLMNELVSDLLLLFPLFAITQQYRAAHLGHHRHVNDPERDPDWIRLDRFEPMRFPKPRSQFLSRYVARGLWPPAILRYLFGRAVAANVGHQATGERPLRAPYSAKVARLLRGSYWLSIFSLIHAARGWPVFWLFWVAPLLTFYPFFMLLREIAHHANAPDDGPLTNSRHFDVNPVLRWAVFPYGQDFHLLHHLFAMIPHHRMREAHALLSRNEEYRARVVVCRGYFFRKRRAAEPSVIELLARREH